MTFITLKPRTSSAIHIQRLVMQTPMGPVTYDLDINAPSQRLIFECCQAGVMYEATTLNVLARALRPGDAYVDVGAHVGFFAMFAAALVGEAGRVICFEPNATNFAALQRQVALNGYRNVTCVNAAVGDKDGAVTFFENMDNDGGHALWDPGLHAFNEKSRAEPQPRTVQMTTLDTMLASLGVASFRALKIDTEGAEPLVLDGGARSIAAAGLEALICEENTFGLQTMGSSPAALRTRLENLGLAVCVPQDNGQFVRIRPDTPVPRSFIDNLYCFRMDAP